MDEVIFHDPRFRVRRLRESEWRKDPVVDRWVIVSTDRIGRADELRVEAPPLRLAECPFCAGNEHLTPHATHVLRDGENWRVRCVPNAFPALRSGFEFREGTEAGLERWSGLGVHEVVVECPHHERDIANLSPAHIADVFDVYLQRIRAASADPRLLYPMIFKNRGADAGASLEHAHSQFLMMPRVPQMVVDELRGADQFLRRTGRCVYCDLLDRELDGGTRLVALSDEFAAFTAFAGRFPFETWIVPRRHESQFAAISAEQVADLARMVRMVLRKLGRGLSDPPYNYYVHTAPMNGPPSDAYHWHLEVLPRLTGIAGFECGTGFAINPVPPEQAAAYLRTIEC